MNNSINKFNATPSFQGSFIVKTATKDAKRIANIQKLFRESTKDMPNDVLALKFDKEDKIDVLQTTKSEGTIFALSEGFNSWLDKFSDNEISKKLTKVLRAFKEEIRFQNKNSDLEMEIEEIARKKRANQFKADTLREHGNEEMAKRFETLAGFNQKKIDGIEAEKQANKEAFLKKVDKIADKDPLFNEYSTIFTE